MEIKSQKKTTKKNIKRAVLTHFTRPKVHYILLIIFGLLLSKTMTREAISTDSGQEEGTLVYEKYEPSTMTSDDSWFVSDNIPRAPPKTCDNQAKRQEASQMMHYVVVVLGLLLTFSAMLIFVGLIIYQCRIGSKRGVDLPRGEGTGGQVSKKSKKKGKKGKNR